MYITSIAAYRTLRSILVYCMIRDRLESVVVDIRIRTAEKVAFPTERSTLKEY